MIFELIELIVNLLGIVFIFHVAVFVTSRSLKMSKKSKKYKPTIEELNKINLIMIGFWKGD